MNNNKTQKSNLNLSINLSRKSKNIVLLGMAGIISFMVFRNSHKSYIPENSYTYSDESLSTLSDKDPTALSTYRSSDHLDFTVKMPEGYDAVERFNTVTLTNQRGEAIIIDQIGTNETDIADYIRNHRNDIEERLVAREEIRIGGFDAIAGFIDETKHYFIYVDYRVYSISTDDPELYDDLVTVAQSFEYTGVK